MGRAIWSCKIVEIAGARIRDSDRLYRYGGEEFLTLLEQTDTRGAIVVAEDIRARTKATGLLPGRTVAVSIGIAQYQTGQSVEAWTKCAALRCTRPRRLVAIE